jgi:hypothetical protein
MRRSSIASAIDTASATVAALRRSQTPAAPLPPPAEQPPAPVPEPEASAPATDAGRWQGDDLEGLPRQPLYTMAGSWGIPERRLSQMSRDDILEMLLRRDRAAGTS